MNLGEEIFEGYPELLTSQHLVDLGIYRNYNSVAKARWRGEGPPEIYVGKKKIRFPKKELLKWINEQNKTYSAGLKRASPIESTRFITK